jgi:hypothetical protein
VPLLVCDSGEVRARVPVTTAAAVAGQQAPPDSPPQRGVETLWLCLGEVGHSMESALRRLRHRREVPRWQPTRRPSTQVRRPRER